MINVEEEIYLWEALLHSVSEVLSEVDRVRTKVKDRWNDETPSYDRAEWLMSDVYDLIEGHLQELDATYSERKACCPKAEAQAKKALSYGVNYQAFKGMSYEETDKALQYIKKQGKASMSYEATRQALLEYRKNEHDKRLKQEV